MATEKVRDVAGELGKLIGSCTREGLKICSEMGIPDGLRDEMIEKLFLMALPSVVNGVTHFGDSDIIEAMRASYQKIGLNAPEPETCRRLISTARENVYDELVTYDSNNQPVRYMDSAERFMRERLAEVQSWRYDTAFRFGIELVDRCTRGIQPGEICVITGPQGTYKTSLAINGMELALENGLSVMFASLDMEPGVIQERRVLRRTEMSQAAYQYYVSMGDTKEILQAMEEVTKQDNGQLRLFGCENGYFDTDELIERIRIERPDVLIVDFLTLVRHVGQSDLDAVNESMPKLKTITQQVKCRTILLSQMSRAAKIDQSSGKFGGHSKGGGVVEELAHCEVELMKDTSGDPENPSVYLTITKNRRGPSGVTWNLDCVHELMHFTGGATRVYREQKDAKPLFTTEKPVGMVR